MINIEKIINKIIGNNDEFELNQRIFIITTLSAVLVTFIGNIIIYIINKDNPLIIYQSILIFIFLSFYLLARKTNLYKSLILIFIIFCLIGISFVWLMNSGSSSPVIAIIMVLITTSLMIFSGLKKYIVFFTIIIFTYLLYFVDFFYPELIISYNNSTSRIIDHVATFTYISIILSIIVNYFIYNYQHEKDKSDKGKEKLEQTTKELVQANNELISQKLELEKLYNELLEKNKLVLEQKNELDNLNEELKQLNFTKDKFISIISHDLRNPAFAIRNMAEVIENYFDQMSHDELKTAIKSIYKTSNFSIDLLENLLNWSRSKSGKIECNFENIKASEIVKQNIELTEIYANKKKIKIINNANNDFEILADKNLINTIFRNLLSNAVKFTRENGTIIIDSYDDEKFVWFNIKDNGIGIRHEVISKLFEIEYHKSSLGTNNEKGTGLGLLIVNEFVNQLGGKIKVHSIYNVGSTFSFSVRKANN